jgi:hypothetical protein
MAEQRFWGLNRTAVTDGIDTDDAASDDDNVTPGEAVASDVAGAAAAAKGSGQSVPVRRIRPTSDPSAVVRSLGPPPLAIDSAVVERHLTAVYEEAVRAATALAAATGLLADDSSDSEDSG